MRTSEIITYCYLRSQSLELLSGRLGHSSTACQLPLTNGVHDFNTGNRTPRRPKRLEAQPRAHHPLPRSLILLYEVIEVLRLPHADGRLARTIVMADRGRVAPTLVNRDLFRYALVANRLAKTPSDIIAVPPPCGGEC